MNTPTLAVPVPETGLTPDECSSVALRPAKLPSEFAEYVSGTLGPIPVGQWRDQLIARRRALGLNDDGSVSP